MTSSLIATAFVQGTTAPANLRMCRLQPIDFAGSLSADLEASLALRFPEGDGDSGRWGWVRGLYCDGQSASEVSEVAGGGEGPDRD